MDVNEYQKYYDKAMKIQQSEEMVKAYEKQTRLSQICKEKMTEWYDYRDKVYDMYLAANDAAENRNVSSPFIRESDSKLEALDNLLGSYISEDDYYKQLKEYIDKVPEIGEAGKHEQEIIEKFAEYLQAQVALDKQINSDKEKLFTKEYLAKMDEYAENGILLYYMELPDAPILDKDVTQEKFLETLTFGECMCIKQLLTTYVTCPSPVISLQRKIEDVYALVDCLIWGYYRTAARTVFALIESEHKNAAQAFEGFASKEREFKNGKDRSNKISQLVDSIDMTRAKETWNKIDECYKKYVSDKDSFINRNVLIHGDYRNDAIDISEHDVVKLILLFLNMSLISSYICNYTTIYENAMEYSLIYMARELKNKNK